MPDDDRAVQSSDQNHSDPKRTRRNVMAMAGVAVGVILASTLATGKAEAGFGDRHHGDPGGWGGGGSPACFLKGTMILTEHGETAVEDLRAGDKLPTLSGHMREIKEIHSWVVERSPDQNWADDAAPVKVCRSAIAPNFPQNDLYLSPLHSLYVDGVLITARNLVNGRSIVRCSDYEAASITYVHVELEDHQVIWAEGAPVESRLAESMVPFAPIWSGGRRFELASRFRSAVSPWLDKRSTFDKVRDRLEARSETELAA